VPPGAGQAARQRGEHEAIRPPPACPRDGPAQDAHLLAQREQLDVARRARAGAHDEDVKEHPNEDVDNGEHHRVSVPVPAVPLA
jgi:hypothetical protein